MAGKRLTYRIVSCSSEDLQANSTELLKQGEKTKGWQTARFCDYPQELIMQFLTPVQISSLKFLSHESKISTKIELWVGQFSHDSSFEKLGYLTLTGNEQSNFKVRELKTVQLERIPATYWKLIFHAPHNNRYNVFNQVGLVSLTVYGEEQGNGPAPFKKEDEHSYFTSVRTSAATNEYDNVTRDRLLMLEAAKNRAVETDDFDEAKRLKVTIDRLKGMSAQLLHLEDQKLLAIREEDYDMAKQIKNEIDRLRNAVATPNEQPAFFAPVQSSSHKSFSEGPPPLHDTNHRKDYDEEDRPIKPKKTPTLTAFIQVAPDICRFWGKQDPGFENQEKLDIHYWKDWAMLIGCPQCQQTIEITWLNDHLLNEWEQKGMQECQRCNEAIPAEEWEQHVEEQAWIPAKPPQINNRCPLWHEDIPPHIEGWQQHILTEGCPNNDRSNF